MSDLPELSAAERSRYEWQLWVRDFGEALVSRIGGVGGAAALHLAAGGIGRLVLAHAGNLRLNDMHRQLLMSTDDIGQPRVASALRRLRELNPHVEIETVAENIGEGNAAALVSRCDAVVSAAPLFSERLLTNREAVRQGKPLIDGAMYELEGRLTTIIPGQTPCLGCVEQGRFA